MNTKTVPTSTLTGPALDWAVAKCEKQVPSKSTGEPFLYEHRLYLQDFHPSSDWSQGGPIIERERIEMNYEGSLWGASVQLDVFGDVDYIYAETPLIAAMRCYVASKLGDSVDVPEELIAP